MLGKRSLRVESLENRRLLACDVSFTPLGGGNAAVCARSIGLQPRVVLVVPADPAQFDEYIGDIRLRDSAGDGIKHALAGKANGEGTPSGPAFAPAAADAAIVAQSDGVAEYGVLGDDDAPVHGDAVGPAEVS